MAGLLDFFNGIFGSGQPGPGNAAAMGFPQFFPPDSGMQAALLNPPPAQTPPPATQGWLGSIFGSPAASDTPDYMRGYGTAARIGAAMKDIGAYMQHRPEDATNVATLNDQIRTQAQNAATYNALMKGVLGTPSPNTNSIPVTPAVPSGYGTQQLNGQWVPTLHTSAELAQGATNPSAQDINNYAQGQDAFNARAAQPDTLFSGGILQGPQADQMRAMLSGLPPDIGAKLLLSTAVDAMSPKESFTLGKDQNRYNAQGQLIASGPHLAPKVVTSADITGLPVAPPGKVWVQSPEGNLALQDVSSPDITFVNGQAIDKRTVAPGTVIPRQPEPLLTPEAIQQQVQLATQKAAGEANATSNIPERPQAPSQLSDDAKREAALFYLQNGKMPVSSRNKADSDAVLNYVAQLKPQGVSDDDWMRGLQNNALALHGKMQAAGTLARQQAVTAVNEDTVTGAGNILNGLVQKGVAGPTNITSANAALQWLGRQMNNPDDVNLQNAIQTYSNEYARVMTGATTGAPSSDSARAEAARRLLNGYTAGTLQSAMKQMNQEMENRSNAYKSAMGQLTGGYNGVAPSAVPEPQIAPAQPGAPRVIQYDAKGNRIQ